MTPRMVARESLNSCDVISEPGSAVAGRPTGPAPQNTPHTRRADPWLESEHQILAGDRPAASSERYALRTKAHSLPYRHAFTYSTRKGKK